MLFCDRQPKPQANFSGSCLPGMKVIIEQCALQEVQVRGGSPDCGSLQCSAVLVPELNFETDHHQQQWQLINLKKPNPALNCNRLQRAGAHLTRGLRMRGSSHTPAPTQSLTPQLVCLGGRPANRDSTRSRPCAGR